MFSLLPSVALGVTPVTPGNSSHEFMEDFAGNSAPAVFLRDWGDSCDHRREVVAI